MFRLWRKREVLVLMPDRVWSGGGRAPVMVGQGGVGNNALFAAFSEALVETQAANRRGLRITVCVSDSFAAIVELPWQAMLVRAAEIDRYAEAQLERQGQGLDASWAMVSYFRHFGANGMAYALRSDFVQRLQETARAYGAVVDAVVPLGACAYARQSRSRRGSSALILREPSRVTALVAGRAGLAAYATEPVAGSAERSVERLLRRLQAEHTLHGVDELVWCADGAGVSAIVERVFASAPCASGTVDFWRL